MAYTKTLRPGLVAASLLAASALVAYHPVAQAQSMTNETSSTTTSADGRIIIVAPVVTPAPAHPGMSGAAGSAYDNRMGGAPSASGVVGPSGFVGCSENDYECQQRWNVPATGHTAGEPSWINRTGTPSTGGMTP